MKNELLRIVSTIRNSKQAFIVQSFEEQLTDGVWPWSKKRSLGYNWSNCGEWIPIFYLGQSGNYFNTFYFDTQDDAENYIRARVHEGEIITHKQFNL